MPCFRPRAAHARFFMMTAAFSLALLTAGCADMRKPGYYDPPAESSRTDADYQDQGGASRNGVVRPPSQIQFGFNRGEASEQRPAPASNGAAAPGGGPGIGGVAPAPAVPSAGANASMKTDAGPSAPAPADHPAQRAFLPQAQTYLGTFPCLSPSAQCQAQRVTLTLGPNGRWRSRATDLSPGKSAAPQTEQGCWNVTGDRPAHVLLLDAQGNARAELEASANNVLSVKSILGQTPNLNYTLTRQPDLDPIDELAGQPLPACE